MAREKRTVKFSPEMEERQVEGVVSFPGGANRSDLDLNLRHDELSSDDGEVISDDGGQICCKLVGEEEKGLENEPSRLSEYEVRSVFGKVMKSNSRPTIKGAFDHPRNGFFGHCGSFNGAISRFGPTAAVARSVSFDPVDHVLMGSLHTAGAIDVHVDAHGLKIVLDHSNNLLDADDGIGG